MNIGSTKCASSANVVKPSSTINHTSRTTTQKPTVIAQPSVFAVYFNRIKHLFSHGNLTVPTQPNIPVREHPWRTSKAFDRWDATTIREYRSIAKIARTQGQCQCRIVDLTNTTPSPTSHIRGADVKHFPTNRRADTQKHEKAMFENHDGVDRKY